MRNPFRKSHRSHLRRTLVFALAPVGLGLIPLMLVAQNREALASVWSDSSSVSGRGEIARGSALRDPADVLAERSPGTRDPGALYSIKPENIAPLSELASVLPNERVLSVVRERPGAGAPLGFGAPAASPFFSGPLAFAPSDLSGIPGLTSGVPALSDGGGAGPGSPGGSSGSGGGSPGSPSLVPALPSLPDAALPEPLPEIDVPSAVPEPSTWLMTIIGFFAIAGALRQRGRAAGNMALPSA